MNVRVDSEVIEKLTRERDEARKQATVLEDMRSWFVALRWEGASFKEVRELLNEMRGAWHEMHRSRGEAWDAKAKSDADFKRLHAEYKNALEVIERLSGQINQHTERMSEYERAVRLAQPIVEALAEAIHVDDLTDEEMDVRAKNAVRLPPAMMKISIGDVEIAAGCLMQPIFNK